MKLLNSVDASKLERMVDPAQLDRSPEDILADISLDVHQKRKLLEDWAADLDARLTADDEGMTPQAPEIAASDAAIRQRIGAALDKLAKFTKPIPVRTWL
ncbi:MAG: hypothetical protein ABS86_01950 [Sphingobium sp. SCN 64-10]|nr:MAG: hypothetical protein ABS86_01950 [Sphingobium sp. SCN 64-10]